MEIEDPQGILTEILEENRLLKEQLKKTVENVEVESLSAIYIIEELEDKIRISGVLLAEGMHNGIWYDGEKIEEMVKNYRNYIIGMDMTAEHEKTDEYGDRVVGKHDRVEFNPTLKAALYSCVIDDNDAVKDVREGRFKATSMRIGERKVTIGDTTRAVDLVPINNTLTEYPACSNCQVFTVEDLSFKYFGIVDESISDFAPAQEEEHSATEAQKKAMKTRCARYPVAPKLEHGGHVTKPSQYASVSEGMFADPCNYKYPMTDKYVMAAWAYASKPENKSKGGYSDAEWSWMRGRIKKRMKVAGHKVEEKYEYGILKEETDIEIEEGEEELKRKRCPYCNELYESISKHLSHCDTRKQTLTRIYKCNYCETTYNCEKEFVNHLSACEKYQLAQENLSEEEPVTPKEEPKVEEKPVETPKEEPKEEPVEEPKEEPKKEEESEPKEEEVEKPPEKKPKEEEVEEEEEEEPEEKPKPKEAKPKAEEPKQPSKEEIIKAVNDSEKPWEAAADLIIEGGYKPIGR